MLVKLPEFAISATVSVVGVLLNTAGVKLFSGIVGGGTVPTETIVTSGLTMLIIVPGVEAGIVETLAGMNKTGMERPVGNRSALLTEPSPVVVSVIVIPFTGILTPAPIIATGPKQTSPVE